MKKLLQWGDFGAGSQTVVYRGDDPSMAATLAFQ